MPNHTHRTFRVPDDVGCQPPGSAVSITAFSAARWVWFGMANLLRSPP